MARRGRRQLKALAVLIAALLSSCQRAPEAATAAGQPPSGRSPSGPSPSRPAPAGTGAVREATCTATPFHVRVVAIRHDSADTIQVELALGTAAKASPAVAGRFRVPDDASGRALMEALDGTSVLTADGRRRLFALHSSTGQPVRPGLAPPAPGGTPTFSARFPAADGPVSLLVPGCAPLSGLPVTTAADPARPEP